MVVFNSLQVNEIKSFQDSFPTDTVFIKETVTKSYHIPLILARMVGFEKQLIETVTVEEFYNYRIEEVGNRDRELAFVVRQVNSIDILNCCYVVHSVFHYFLPIEDWQEDISITGNDATTDIITADSGFNFLKDHLNLKLAKDKKDNLLLLQGTNKIRIQFDDVVHLQNYLALAKSNLTNA